MSLLIQDLFHALQLVTSPSVVWGIVNQSAQVTSRPQAWEQWLEKRGGSWILDKYGRHVVNQMTEKKKCLDLKFDF